MAADEQISMDAAVAAVLTELDGILARTEDRRSGLKVFRSGKSVSFTKCRPRAVINSLNSQ